MIRLFFIVICLNIFLLSCAKSPGKEISSPSMSVLTLLEVPNQVVDKSVLIYNNKTSIWTLNEELYSGFSISYFQDSIIQEKIGFLNGRKQNEVIVWFSDGHYKQVSNYHKGKLHGEKKTWSSDPAHVLVSHLNYKFGKVHGEQKKWYPTGELFKKLNLNMGKEEGMQQAYRKNGDLFANYEARDGRIFGLKKAALCFGIEDKNIQYDK